MFEYCLCSAVAFQCDCMLIMMPFLEFFNVPVRVFQKIFFEHYCMKISIELLYLYLNYCDSITKS